MERDHCSVSAVFLILFCSPPLYLFYMHSHACFRSQLLYDALTFFFFFICMLQQQLIPAVSSLEPLATVIPLVFVLSISAIKEAIDDFVSPSTLTRHIAIVSQSGALSACVPWWSFPCHIANPFFADITLVPILQLYTQLLFFYSTSVVQILVLTLQAINVI